MDTWTHHPYEGSGPLHILRTRSASLFTSPTSPSPTTSTTVGASTTSVLEWLSPSQAASSLTSGTTSSCRSATRNLRCTMLYLHSARCMRPMLLMVEQRQSLRRLSSPSSTTRKLSDFLPTISRPCSRRLRLSLFHACYSCGLSSYRITWTLHFNTSWRASTSWRKPDRAHQSQESKTPFLDYFNASPRRHATMAVRPRISTPASRRSKKLPTTSPQVPLQACPMPVAALT